MNGIDTLLTVRQLQEILQVDRITIYRMLADGRLQGFKVGGQWRFPRQAIEDWLRQQQANLGALEPKTSPTKMPLSPSPDALPLSCLSAIQDIFAQASGIAAVTTALNGTPLTPVANPCQFCTLILDSRAGQQRCTSSWRAAVAEPQPVSGSVQGKMLRLATCHAGLHYLWEWVEIEGQPIAAVYAGQFLDSPADGEEWLARLTEVAAATGRPIQELQTALAQVPVLDQERQQQLSCLLQRVAATFAEIGAERLNLLGRLRRIAEMTAISS